MKTCCDVGWQGAWNKTERNVLPAVAHGRDAAVTTLNLTQRILDERIAAGLARLPAGHARDVITDKVGGGQ